MSSKSKILATVSLIGLMAMAPLQVANAADEDILEQLRMLQERLDSQAKQIDALQNVNSKRAEAMNEQKEKMSNQGEKLTQQNKKLVAQNKKIASQSKILSKQSKQIKSLRYRDIKLFSKAKKAGDKRSNEALSNEALFNVGMAEDGVYDAIFEAVDEHETNLHASKLKVGGWVNVQYVNTNQTSHKQYFNPDALYLFFDAKLDDNWRGYSELEFEGSPLTETQTASKGAIALERAYIEYTHNDLIKARFGKFDTPLGIWTPEHWTINVPSITVPIHEANLYIEPKSVGMELTGNYYSQSKNKWAPDFNYHTWVSNGADIFATDSPTDGKLGYGGQLTATFNSHYDIGLSIYSQNAVTPSTTTSSGSAPSTVKEFVFMPYTKIELPHRVTLTGEYMRIDRDNGFKDIDTWYASAQWWFDEKSYLYYRRDFGDDGATAVNITDGTTLAVDTFTLGYWPKPYVRAKLEWSTHNYNDATQDFDQWAASIGVTF